MKCTEAEARKKCCPMGTFHDQELECCGSYCMAWVWDDPETEEYCADGGEPLTRPRTDRRGHCGMVRT